MERTEGRRKAQQRQWWQEFGEPLTRDEELGQADAAAIHAALVSLEAGRNLGIG